MPFKKIDARGVPCPRPLIMTKKAYDELKEGETCLVILDNETSCSNVEQYLKDAKVSYEIKKMGREIFVTLGKGKEIADLPIPQERCSFPQGSHVICLSSDQMGQGSAELGKLLIQGFINTIKETKPLPTHIVFYNSGVLLSLQESSVLASLKELEFMGVSLWACGTCLDYFKVKEKLGVGKITNMYSILEMLTKASHVITP